MVANNTTTSVPAVGSFGGQAVEIIAVGIATYYHVGGSNLGCGLGFGGETVTNNVDRSYI